jgi:Glycosyltransferase family 9 (heptosyltransferase)
MQGDNATAVVKPDHIGDFVLALPAIRALAGVIPRFDLLAAPGNRFLFDRFLGQDVRFVPTTFTHLARGADGLDEDTGFDALRGYGTVIMLRLDAVLAEIADRLGSTCRVIVDRNDWHETAQHLEAVGDITGTYSRTRMMWPGGPPVWPGDIGHLGISLSAGFTSNKVPLARWITLARALGRDGVRISLIGGPQERSELAIARSELESLDPRVIVGSADVPRFEEELAACDAVVGADSGSLHLISHSRPVLGVFTSSPWQRFAPFGAHVRVVHATVPCAPCLQYSAHAFNACVTRECAGLIETQHLVDALRMPLEHMQVVPLSDMVRVISSPSHVSTPAGVISP